MSAILFSPDDKHTIYNLSDKVPPSLGDSSSAHDVCDESLSNQMGSLDLNAAAVHHQQQQQLNFESSDSGVDMFSNASMGVTHANLVLQRTLWNNSNVGLGEHSTTEGVNTSCGSIMISCKSGLGEQKVVSGSGGSVESNASIISKYECLSENGSESSSVAGSTAATLKGLSIRKKKAVFEPGMQGSSYTPSHAKKGSAKKQDFKTPVVTVSGQLEARISQTRPRYSTLKRTASLPRPSQAADIKHITGLTDKVANAATPSHSRVVNQIRGSKQLPDSLPSSLSRTHSMSMQRLAQRTPSTSRARTPGTPSDDGRWPGVCVNGSSRSVGAKRGCSVTPDLASWKPRSIMLVSMESRSSNNSNPYSTLPRRRKQKSVEDLTGRNSRSSSISRDTRMTSSVVLNSRRNLVNSYGCASPPTQVKMMPSILNVTKSASVAARKPLPNKTRIYHETSVQTALTNEDLEKILAGGFNAGRPVDAAEQRDQQTQSDSQEHEIERLRDEVRQLTQREHELGAKLQREREEKLVMQRELHLNTERVIGMLEMARLAGGGGAEVGTPNSDSSGGHDSLLMLESQIQMSGHELIERQQEIGHLRQLCRSLQLEMERSLAAQECLLQEKVAFEQESNELQDFLQHEKATMCEALKEIEAEYQTCKQQLTSRDEEVKVLRDECRHLVRLNEQRRQENRMLQSKYTALDAKSKDLVTQQNSSVSGASAALSRLHTRLDNLVEQLVSSYSISEQDLEDIGFQSDIQGTNGTIGTIEVDNDGNGELLHEQKGTSARHIPNSLDIPSSLLTHQQLLPQSSDGSLSPQRNQSFIAAVINAIRNATTPAGKRLLTRNNKRSGKNHCPSATNNSNHNNVSMEQPSNAEDSDSTEMLDSETEPCLMMDNVLEDVAMPDSHSHNMMLSCTNMISQIETPSLVNITTGDESLHNLSQAITNRQQMEMQINTMHVLKEPDTAPNGHPFHENSMSESVSCYDSEADIPSLLEYCCSTQAVVDQVIEVDGLVTKLLKVLRLIQMDNDSCIQQLIVDKNKLQQNKEDMLEKLKDLKDMNIKLQDELMDATQELMLKNNDLSNTKAEMQRHRNEIDCLTEEICNLSTLCINYRKMSPTTEFPPMQHQVKVHTPDFVAAGKDENDDVIGILNLLRIWHSEGYLKDQRVGSFLVGLLPSQKSQASAECISERERVYANQLENIFKVLQRCDVLEQSHPMFQQLRNDLEVVKLNANWEHILGVMVVDAKQKAACDIGCSNTNTSPDVNANAIDAKECLVIAERQN